MNQLKLFDSFLVSKSTPQQLQQFLKSQSIKYQSTKISQSVHIRSKTHGFEIQYQKQAKQQQQKYKLACIFLYINNPKYTSYPILNTLPYKLAHKSTIMSTIMLLGQATTKSKYLIQCSWKNLGIDIIFNGISWNDDKILIDYICLYQQPNNLTNKQIHKQCSVCKKQQKQQLGLYCQNCKIIFYCGVKCKQQYYRLHRMYCQDIDQS